MKDGKTSLDKVLLGLKSEQLSTIPSALFQILQISSNPNASAADLASVFGRDQSSAARLVKTANSALYSALVGTKVDRVEDAIVRVGFKAAREVAVTAFVCNLFRAGGAVGAYSLEELWRHSMSVAMGARLLYSSISVHPGYDPYLAGLFHDIGIVLEHQFLFEDGFATAVREQDRNQSLLSDEEMRFLGTSHEEIGAAVGRRWGFPEHILFVIRNHHKFEAATSEERVLTHVVRVAEWISSQLHLGYSDFPAAHELYYQAARLELGLDESILEMVSGQLQVEYRLMAGLDWFKVA